ncbi:unnamed protein product [Agarophyton chilense]
MDPNTMQRFGYKVMDIGVFQDQNCSKFVATSLWPLEVVDEGFIALDELSRFALGFSWDNELIHMPSMQSSKKKPRNRKGKWGNPSQKALREQRRQRMDLDQDYGHEKSISSKDLLKLSLIKVIDRSYVKDARSISLACDFDLDFLESDECSAMVHASLLGKVVATDMVVSVSVLGENSLLNVITVDDDFKDSGNSKLDPSRTAVYNCTKDTVVEIVSTSHGLGTKEKGLFQNIGSLAGLDNQLKEAQAIVVAATRTKTINNAQVPIPMFAKKPQGLLIYGPAGTGKTMMACVLAKTCGLNFEVISGPEIVSKSTSEALRTIQNCFNRAHRKGPSLILLDEVDAIAPRRDLPSLDDIQRKLTAAMLTIMDNQDGSELENVVVVGTTSRLEVIDAAMRRPGRFDREIEITVPNAAARVQILKNLVREASAEVSLEVSDEELETIAILCYGYVGADIVSLWREAISVAYNRSSDPSISQADFKEALRIIRPSALREIAVEIPTTSWNDVGGKAEAKQRLQEAVEWPLSENGSQAFSSVGITPPRGILLYGPPGCSKTLLARAVSTESKANFISVKGAELLSKWVGESEKAVRNIFRRARQAAPCVIFFDEIDALATSRSFVAGASAQARVVAQLLSEMDGIDTTEDDRVVVIAATNRPDCLDSAFLRPGRIDVQIYVGLPDHDERISILKVHTRKVPLSEDVDLLKIAGCTEGYSGAELAAVVREAALCAMEQDVCNASVVSGKDFSTAVNKVKPRTPASILEYFDSYNKQLQNKLFGTL